MVVRDRLSRLAAATLALVLTTVASGQNALAAPPSPGAAGTLVQVKPKAPDIAPRSAPASITIDPALRCDAVRERLAAQRSKTPAACLTPGNASPQTLRPLARSAAAPVWCDDLGDGQYWYTRDSICLDGLPVTFTLLSPQGGVIGMALLEVSQSIQLNTTSASWEEQAHIYMAARAGQVSSLLVELTATCSGSCTVPKSSAWGVESLTLFELESGELRFSGNPPANGQNLINPEWTLTVLAPGAVPIIPSVSWNLPDVLTIRCDRLVGSQAGCVVPSYTPTLLLSVATDGASAIMILWAQQYLPDAWGYEYGGTPLRRLASEALQRTNRNIICDSTFVPRPEVPNDSCDEYPFAATYESGAMLGLTGSDCAEVLPFIDDVTGLWYVRYLKTVTGNERCVRGHVSLPSNTDVGGDLGRFVVAQRVLDFEEFWVGVTA